MRESSKYNCIYLIGFMGAGKTFLGNYLAQELQLEFVDTDEIITSRFNCSIKSLFDNEGEEGFRQIEYSVLKDLITKRKRAVVATGGGLPCNDYNLALMKKNGITVFLDWPIETLVNRIKYDSHRPLINAHKMDLLEYVTKELNLRRPFYEKACLVLKNPTTEDILDAIRDRPQFLNR